MFLDFRKTDIDKNIEADICIIGAGAAGITLAHSFIGSHMEVCILESGGFELDNQIQLLYDGDSVGPNSINTAHCRLRFFGGSTNNWNGWCAPLSDIDFEPRPWVPHSGWPIRKKDLDDYYEAAHKVCDLGPYRYDVDALADETRTFPNFLPSKLTTYFWQFSPPTRFGQKYRSELNNAENVKVYLYANVTELEVNENASEVRGARIRTFENKTGYIKARYFVLACGGIENARTLLTSNAVQKEGLGNGSGLVGRFFMQHPHHNSSAVILANDPDTLYYLFKRYKINGVNAIAGVSPSTQAQESLQILNYSAPLKFFWDAEDGENGYSVLNKILNTARRGDWPNDLSRKLWTVITDLDSVSKGLYNRVRGRSYRLPFNKITLDTRSEQTPNPDSRVTLSEERDRLGLRKVNISWQLTDLDKQTIRMANQIIAEEFGRLNLGRIKLADWLVEEDLDWPEGLWGGCHHMGTTRMANVPTQGVVDRNCRVHSVNNLYIAGSSVFSTGGCANPTLTIVALALRLSEHLKEKFV